MELIFRINGEKPDPYLGIIEGYIQEGINQVSTIELILVSRFLLSDSTCADYIGKPVTLDIAGLVSEKSAKDSPEEKTRKVSRFDGCIYEFHVLDEACIEQDLYKYQMIVRPRLWDLNFFVRARSFPNRTRVDVVKEILTEHGFAPDHHFKELYQNPSIYPKHFQLVQNQISDLVFLQRILQEAGINYYFASDKEGVKASVLKLTDNNIYFDEMFCTVVPYKPDSGQLGEYGIERFETHYRAVPKKAVATNYLGDGKTQVFNATRTITEGKLGEFRSFGVEGETCEVSKRSALLRAQYFQASRVLYEGRSNHFLFRPAEKFKLETGWQMPVRLILMTTLFHHFHQSPRNAVSGENQVAYRNYFTGTDKCAEIRPFDINTKTIVEMKRLFSSHHSLSRSSAEKDAQLLDIDELEKQSLKKQVLDLKAELSILKDQTGVMVGEVIEDAKVTQNNELVCVVKNEQFPKGITVKIALGWLSQHGWLSLLPRVGVQVYFQFIAGAGGNHEAVLLGYRPTCDHPTMNPAKKTESANLKSDDDNATDDESFFPLNKHRNALMGEDGVAEIAVVDGGEDSVYLRANNRVSVNGDKSVSIKTKSLLEKADGVHQRYGALTRKVSKNQKTTIGGNLEQTVDENVKVTSVNQFIELKAKKMVKLHDEKGAEIALADDVISLKEPGENQVGITPEAILAKAGVSQLMLQSADAEPKATLVVDHNAVQLEKECISIKTPTNMITVEKSGKIVLFSDEIEIVAKKLTMQGSDGVKVYDGSGGSIVASGGEIKLNC